MPVQLKPRRAPRLLLVLALAVVVSLLAMPIERSQILGPYGRTVGLYGALIFVTLAALFLLVFWRKRLPLRDYGSVLDPKERPRAYALCMGVLTFVFAAIAVLGWFRVALSMD